MVLEEGDVGLLFCGVAVHNVPDRRGQDFLYFSFQSVVFLGASATFFLLPACVVEFG